MSKKASLLGLIVSLGVVTVSGFCAPRDSESPGPGAGQSDSNWEKDPRSWKVAIYPVFAWAPVMGASINLPDLPSLPDRPSTGPGSGTASGSFNGAGFAGVEIQKSGWSTNGEFLYASLSGDNTNPKVHLGVDVFYGQLMGGHTLWKDLSLEGGVRRMALKISASVGDRPEVDRKPGIWDPLIGMTWRHQAGKKWMFRAHLDGGGFGVGSDLTLAASARADWRFAKHFGLAMGFGAIHFQVANTILDNTSAKRTLSVRQTLYGPLFGFGIHF